MTSFVNYVDTFPKGEGKKNSDISSFFFEIDGIYCEN